MGAYTLPLTFPLQRFCMSDIVAQMSGCDNVRDATKVPVELIHLILAFISDDNDRHETLAACSLVCRVWHNMCCRHIFQSVVISEHLAPRLTFFCATAPHLSKYIRDLDISWSRTNCFTPTWRWGSRAVFKNLRTLRLSNGTCSVSGPSPLLSITAFLLAAPRLKELTLRGWAFSDLRSLYAMLALCSNTLEQLTFNGVSFIYWQEDTNYVVSSPTRMGALRKLVSPPQYHPIIECPNLESLAIHVHPGDVWALPSWVPSGLRDLTLHATARRAIPDLGHDIRPSSLELSLYGACPYSRSVHWMQSCINRLPFPQHLRHLTISLQRPNIIFPEDSDYLDLLEVLQRLRERSALVHIDLEIAIFIQFSTTPDWADVEAREVPKLKQGLDPLFKANVLHAAFTVRRQTSDEELEILMNWEGEIEFNTKEPWSTLQTPLALGITTLLEAPHLRKLSMEQLHFGDDTRSLLSMLSLCSASLEDLQLCNCDAHADTNDEAHGLLPINLVALSSLRLDYVHHPVLTESLVRCPNLEAMVIGMSDLRESWSLWVPSSVDHLQLIAFSWTSIPTFEKTTRISALSINRTTPDAALSDFGEWVERCIDNLPHPDLLTELTLEHAVNPTYDDHIEYPADYGAFSSSVARLLARGVIRISVSITITVDFADPEEAITISTADQIASPLTEMPIFEIGHTHLGPQYQNSNLHIASAHPANYSASLARLLAIVPRVRISVSITITAKPIQGLDEVRQARELERLKDSFALVLGSGVDIRLCVEQGFAGEYELVLNCRV
ncbi:hypothetical protein EYR36_011471 [Pleurotus pulmonarius]|nr:hypothetical protein EYR36_011471 [Pleurotus pulmonarius]